MAANPEITADSPEAREEGADLTPLARLRQAFAQINSQQKILLAVAFAAIIGVIVGFWLWNREPAYKVLFSNFSEKDGGQIIAALEQANVPYRYTEGGAAILVPADMVHGLRLRLATQGLPRGGSVGFELMENQKFGVSQFAEQVNYQRALEGELSRTIEAIASVESARVHLAIPKPSVFVRDEQKPTASVLLHLHPGALLDKKQIAGITHLIASSVPQMPIANVNIIDQDGNLLSQIRDQLAEEILDPKQLRYVREVENNVIERIRDILRPVVGEGNYRAQVAADLDFSHTEQTAETYRPNGTPSEANIRSQQTSESTNLTPGGQGGIPGALTNQPPVPAIAPLSQPPITPPPGEAGAPAQTANANPQDPNRGRVDIAGVDAPVTTLSPPLETHRDVTTNYELDRTVRYTRQAAGMIRRLSAAVVVNYRMVKDAKTGEEKQEALPESELQQIHNLVREAMGFNSARGDALSVANAPFTPEIKTESGEPIWKNPENVARGLEVMKYLVIAGILFLIYFLMIRPVLRAMFPPPPPPPEESAVAGGGETASAADASESAAESSEEELALRHELDSFAAKLEKARDITRSDPKITANMIKDWLGLNASA
ncbi:MAG: flagellar M-ring protein FliF [Zoogloeaceae bacterium]|jgi:flagellar M-ring protein FliF|nr:flagellar M-ring protein FliF [Zoogloeaceae bacterium]